ncbi:MULTISPECIES: hypothetical protein [unclassified Bradyrhizobium]|uniref:hypothetical protein n=1 Tax=unclassified Bradyrhizobium TaxID=2631580 RepID=UPI001FFBBEF2|nr:MULTISPECIES: hypothetical protein [unclassified Bradyrhizobium]MCK1707633.1 hypothetical protein [Bradyrhizobium sp. 143]MCK1724844.1 hypothetical protein [Bradyrhizobium sp. 142]
MDSFSSKPATGQPETGERTSDSLRPVPSQSNVVTFPGKLPASNVRELRNPTPEGYEPRTTRRQLASRKRNLLRHPCNRVSLAVTIAGRIQRGEEIGCWGSDPITELRKGAAAARELALALEIIAEEFALEARK